MAQMIGMMPHLERAKKSQVYAVITIPATVKSPCKKASFLQNLAWAADAALSFGLGIFLLVFVLLLIISL